MAAPGSERVNVVTIFEWHVHIHTTTATSTLSTLSNITPHEWSCKRATKMNNFTVSGSLPTERR